MAGRQSAATAGAVQRNSSGWSAVNNDGGEGKGGAERDPAAELEVTAVERAVELEVATLSPRFPPPAGVNCSGDARRGCARLLEAFSFACVFHLQLVRKRGYMQMRMGKLAGDRLIFAFRVEKFIS
jgi:hypothetical protein